MSFSIATNTASSFASNALRSTQASLATSAERLSSGKRVNSAKDDAAGLAISERMTSQIRGLDVVERNVNDGVSLLQIADAGLITAQDILQRMRELAVQSLNGSNTSSDRSSLQQEITQLQDAFDAIKNSTQFNGMSLLDGTITSTQITTGANAGQVLSIDLSDQDNTGPIAITSEPKLMSDISTTHQVRGINVSGGYAYVSPGGNGNTFDVIDVSDPAQPYEIGSLDLGVITGAIGINGNVAYVGTYYGGLKVVDISNPAQPTLITTYSGTANIGDIKIRNNLAYISQADFYNNNINELLILDISNPSAISALGSVLTTGRERISLSGNYAVVSSVYTGAEVIDISNSSSPSLVSSLSTIGNTYDNAISRGYAYLPDSSGIKIYDINNPTSPTLVGAYSSSSFGNLSISGDKLYGMQRSGSGWDLVTLDISNPVNPSLVSSVRTSLNGAPDVKAIGNTVYVGCQSEGFKIFYSGISAEDINSANSSLNSLDLALDKVNRTRAKVGGYLSRMDSIITNVKSMSTNLSSSRAAIVDADYAQETANLSRAQILQQAATAMVAQANMSKQTVMALLKNI